MAILPESIFQVSKIYDFTLNVQTKTHDKPLSLPFSMGQI